MILVTGATGSIGRHLVDRLRQERAAFRAFVRSEGKGRALGCDFTVGDFDDPASLRRALDGVDRLFLNAGGAVPADGEQPMVGQQVAAIDAAGLAGVARIVKISVWGARDGGPLATGAHWRIEQHLKASGTRWSVLQPSGFMQNFLTGAGALMIDGKLVDPYGGGAVSYIDAFDIAGCAAELLTGAERAGETFVVTGPESLTGADIAAKLSAAAGRALGSVSLAPDDVAAGLARRGLPQRFAADIAELSRDVARGSLAGTTGAVRELTGREPRTFDQFLAANRDAVRAAF